MLKETKSITCQHKRDEQNDYLQSQDSQIDNQTNPEMASNSHGIRVLDNQGARNPNSRESKVVANTNVADNHGIRVVMVQA